MARTRNQENSAKRKNQILQAAIKAFARSGLKETSMDDIVRESGMSKGAIYWYFKSKDELIKELLNVFFYTEMPETLRLLTATGTASSRINNLLEFSIEEVERMMRFRPFMHELYVLASRNKTIRKLAKRDLDTYCSVLETIIRQGIEQGEFHRVDPHKVAVAIVGLIEGSILLWSLGITDVDIEKHLLWSVNMMVDALKTT